MVRQLFFSAYQELLYDAARRARVSRWPRRPSRRSSTTATTPSTGRCASATAPRRATTGPSGPPTPCGGSPASCSSPSALGGPPSWTARIPSEPSTGTRSAAAGPTASPAFSSRHPHRPRPPSSRAPGRPAPDGRGCTPSPSGGCSPRCSTCTAATRGRHGDRGGAPPASADLTSLGAGSVPDPELPVVTLAELGVLRGRPRDLRPAARWRSTSRPRTRAARPSRPWPPTSSSALLEHGVPRGHRPHGPRPAVDHRRHHAPRAAASSPRPASRRRAAAPHRATAPSRSLSRSAARTADRPRPTLLSRFSSTACKALRRCESCREPFDHFKEL